MGIVPSYVQNFCSMWAHSLYSRPEAAAGVRDIVPGHGGPLQVHLGLHVGGGTSSGLDIAPSTIVLEPVVLPFFVCLFDKGRHIGQGERK